jgi:hypothetical protein
MSISLLRTYSPYNLATSPDLSETFLSNLCQLPPDLVRLCISFIMIPVRIRTHRHLFFQWTSPISSGQFWGSSISSASIVIHPRYADTVHSFDGQKHHFDWDEMSLFQDDFAHPSKTLFGPTMEAFMGMSLFHWKTAFGAICFLRPQLLADTCADTLMRLWGGNAVSIVSMHRRAEIYHDLVEVVKMFRELSLVTNENAREVIDALQKTSAERERL